MTGRNYPEFSNFYSVELCDITFYHFPSYVPAPFSLPASPLCGVCECVGLKSYKLT